MTTTQTPTTLLALHDADPEGLNVIAAELDGWKPVGNPQYAWFKESMAGDVGAWPNELPRYSTSLDAVAELEEGLTDEEFREFSLHLRGMIIQQANARGVSDMSTWAHRAYISAPAHLRLIAWVLTKQTI